MMQILFYLVCKFIYFINSHSCMHKYIQKISTNDTYSRKAKKKVKKELIQTEMFNKI